MQKSVVLGVDIGGTHVTAALIDLESRSLLADSLKRIALDARESKEFLLQAWSTLMLETFGDTPFENRYVGIAMPGPFDYESGICLIESQDKFRALYGVNIKEALAATLHIPIENIRFINDAASFLQGEVFAGAAQANARVMGLTLGTGLGSSFCFNGKASDAALWNAPFLGGIAEDYLSSRWFVKRFQNLSGKVVPGVKELLSYTQEDASVTRIFMEFGRNLAEFLIPILKESKIDTLVLGGNIAQAFHQFSPELLATLRGKGVTTVLKVSKLNEHAALIGAASCCSLM
ncbi:ROK family protein [Pedobacter sp. MW01-1-1]|uniref:ROK family protein n=1 Tax=Pedobacter sp. MW01-1-1 TaxID=3383027 RepID=UPI003FEDDD1D